MIDSVGQQSSPRPGCKRPDDWARTVHAVVVTYLPDPVLLSELLERMAPQVARIQLVDNTPQGFVDDAWSQRVAEAAGGAVTVHRLGRNMGIAAALNIGMRHAFAQGADYVLLSDQDSLPDHDMVGILVGEAEHLEQSGFRVGCICPAYLDMHTETWHRFQVERPGHLFYGYAEPEPEVRSQEIVVSISSGSLISKAAFDGVGPMNETFFIDHVDSEWCLRARALGFRNFGVGRAILRHRLGERGISIWLGRWHALAAYSPSRLYYRFRNFILLGRLAHVPTLWTVRAARFWLLTAYAETVFSASRFQNARAILLGIADGVMGRSGPSRRSF